jgi:hypothetical protein
MKNKSEKIFAVLVAIMFLILLICIRFSDKKANELLSDYRTISQHESIYFRIIDIKKHRGSSLISTSNGEKIKIIDVYYNQDFNEKYFYGFVKKYDSIIKKANCDTLYLMRENKKYFFTKMLNVH